MIKTGRLWYMIGFTDHFETCINATYRCIQNFEGMRAELKVARTNRKALEAAAKNIPEMRHKLEHMDEIIRKGELRPGEPIMIALAETDDKALIAGEEIAFVDLERTLRRLHAAGCAMFNEPPPNETGTTAPRGKLLGRSSRKGRNPLRIR